jgi:hypothetical protein
MDWLEEETMDITSYLLSHNFFISLLTALKTLLLTCWYSWGKNCIAWEFMLYIINIQTYETFMLSPGLMSFIYKAVIYVLHILNRNEMRVATPTLDNDNFLIKLLFKDCLSLLLLYILIKKAIWGLKTSSPKVVFLLIQKTISASVRVPESSRKIWTTFLSLYIFQDVFN